MKFEEALKAMKAGSKAKLPSWGGYWYWSPEKETIIMHTKDGDRCVPYQQAGHRNTYCR